MNHDKIQFIEQVCKKYNNDKTRMMDILWDIQDKFQCVDSNSMTCIAKNVGSHRVEIEGVVTFYAFYSTTPKGKIIIRLCDDIIDQHAGIDKIAATISNILGIKVGETSSDLNFSLEYTPCIGMCDQVPAMLVNDVVFTSLTVDKVKDICLQLKKDMNPKNLIKNFGDGNNAKIHSMVKNNIKQRGPVILSNDFSAESGLDSALKLSPNEVVSMVEKSKLRGRGGAGFSTGTKWKMASETAADNRYIICNADEGEPGTFKDRVLLTEYADLLFEGMTIAAYGVGSKNGILYLRAEYRYLRDFLESVLNNRRKQNLLGINIKGKKDFNFDIRIQLGAGAYICGEEMSLISSCEGLRGEPKNKPPFPVQKGYLNYPTVVNNVETLCTVPRILTKGADWFTQFGTEKSKGTRLLSVSGDCANAGIYEVPFGVTIREVLQLAGAIDPAIVVVGGPSGSIIGRTAFDRKVSFEDLPTGGAFIIFNSHRNIMKIVDYYMQFFIDESCGYCTPCRVGNVFLRDKIQKIMKGNGVESDITDLRELADTVIKTSRCGLGKTSPNPILSTLEHFPVVYSSMINDCEYKTGFNIQDALQVSRQLAKRRSMIYDVGYDGSNSNAHHSTDKE